MALYSYRRRTLSNGVVVIDCGAHGKQDVSADFDALALEALMAEDSPDIVAILDGVADGHALTDTERAQVRRFEARFRAMVLRHNGRLERSGLHGSTRP